MLKDLSWYDNPKNTVGALTTRLAADAAQVQGVSRIGDAVIPKDVAVEHVSSLIRPQACVWLQ